MARICGSVKQGEVTVRHQNLRMIGIKRYRNPSLRRRTMSDSVETSAIAVK
jgi:hypothetical protein